MMLWMRFLSPWVFWKSCGSAKITTWEQLESTLSYIGLGALLGGPIFLTVVSAIYYGLDTGKWHSKIKKHVARFIYLAVIGIGGVIFVEGLAFSLECMESKSIEEVGDSDE